jgi:hypothetical protein
MSYPRSELTARPYRLWDANAKKQMRWRYYSDPKRAHMGALVEARWSKVGVCIEVFNANNGRLLGQYKRAIQTIEFTGE